MMTMEKWWTTSKLRNGKYYFLLTDTLEHYCYKNHVFMYSFYFNRSLDLVAMSLCGGLENGTGPSDEEFDRNLVQYSEVSDEETIFAFNKYI